jgi:hypothetical protein
MRGLEVLDRNGQSLGRVHEVRCNSSPSRAARQGAPEIADLVCGGQGIRVRFGARPRKVVTVRWTDIVEFKRGKLLARIEKPEN